MTDKDLKKIRDIVAVEIKSALRFANGQQSLTNHKLDLLYERMEKVEDRLETVGEKLDSQTVDIHSLQEQMKALWDWAKELKERQERRFKEIREDLGLAS